MKELESLVYLAMEKDLGKNSDSLSSVYAYPTTCDSNSDVTLPTN